MSPLHRCVANGHVRTARRLLGQTVRFDWECDADAEARELSRTSALALAAGNNDVRMTSLLLGAKFDANLKDVHGETPLHIAARLGFDECVEALLNRGEGGSALDITDKSGRTPLLAAAANGNLRVAQLLLDAGANPKVLDAGGRSAREHAAYRGHLAIGELLPSPVSINLSSRASRPAARRSPVQKPKVLSSRATLLDPPIKDTIIVLCLGSMDTRKDIQPIELDPVPTTYSKRQMQLNQPMTLAVFASEAPANFAEFHLPLLEDVTTEPIVFSTKDVEEVKIFFDLRARSCTRPIGHVPLIGRGVAILSSLDGSVWEKRVNLCNDVSIPIVAADTLDVIGRVNFNFIVVTPFSHPKMDAVSDHSWRIDPPTVIGHRGGSVITGEWCSKQCQVLGRISWIGRRFSRWAKIPCL
jgi:glycerophosphodiester phosphodiesterase